MVACALDTGDRPGTTDDAKRLLRGTIGAWLFDRDGDRWLATAGSMPGGGMPATGGPTPAFTRRLPGDAMDAAALCSVNAGD